MNKAWLNSVSLNGTRLNAAKSKTSRGEYSPVPTRDTNRYILDDGSFYCLEDGSYYCVENN